MLRGSVRISEFSFGAVLLVPVFVAGQQNAADIPRRVISRVVPAYPELARTMNVKGAVRLEVVVAPNGTAKSVTVIRGHPVLAQAAERAVQKWKWERSGRETNEPIELRFIQSEFIVQ